MARQRAKEYSKILFVSGHRIIDGKKPLATINSLNLLPTIQGAVVGSSAKSWKCQFRVGEDKCGVVNDSFTPSFDHVENVHMMAQYRCHKCGQTFQNRPELYAEISHKRKPKYEVNGKSEVRNKAIDAHIDYEKLLEDVDDTLIPDRKLDENRQLYVVVKIG